MFGRFTIICMEGLIWAIKTEFSINHLLLIFKLYLYMLKEHGAVCFTNVKLYLIKIKTIEHAVARKRKDVEQN